MKWIEVERQQPASNRQLMIHVEMTHIMLFAFSLLIISFSFRAFPPIWDIQVGGLKIPVFGIAILAHIITLVLQIRFWIHLHAYAQRIRLKYDPHAVPYIGVYSSWGARLMTLGTSVWLPAASSVAVFANGIHGKIIYYLYLIGCSGKTSGYFYLVGCFGVALSCICALLVALKLFRIWGLLCEYDSDT
jgi:hypothetical protein